jgi:formate-dependent nitrite reductase membrane component NrfD
MYLLLLQRQDMIVWVISRVCYLLMMVTHLNQPPCLIWRFIHLSPHTGSGYRCRIAHRVNPFTSLISGGYVESRGSWVAEGCTALCLLCLFSFMHLVLSLNEGLTVRDCKRPTDKSSWNLPHHGGLGSKLALSGLSLPLSWFKVPGKAVRC